MLSSEAEGILVQFPTRLPTYSLVQATNNHVSLFTKLYKLVPAGGGETLCINAEMFF